MTTYSTRTTGAGTDQDPSAMDEINGVAYESPADLRAADQWRSHGDGGVGGEGRFGATNVAMPERIASGIAGAAMATYAVTKRRDVGGAAIALAGGFLLFRGLTGHCMGYAVLRMGTGDGTSNPNATIAHGQGVKVMKSQAIMQDRQACYDFWRNFENLPKFMRHLQSVSVTGDKTSHWVASAPMGKTIEWDAEIINEIPGELIAWRSKEGADIPNAGSVRFETIPAGRGTKVTVNLEYDPPAGILGAIVAKLFGEEPNQQVRDDLRRFKNLMEAGEIPTVEGQPQGNATGYTTTVGPMRANA